MPVSRAGTTDAEQLAQALDPALLQQLMVRRECILPETRTIADTGTGRGPAGRGGSGRVQARAFGVVRRHECVRGQRCRPSAGPWRGARRGRGSRGAAEREGGRVERWLSNLQLVEEFLKVGCCQCSVLCPSRCAHRMCCPSEHPPPPRPCASPLTSSVFQRGALRAHARLVRQVPGMVGDARPHARACRAGGVCASARLGPAVADSPLLGSATLRNIDRCSWLLRRMR